MNLAREKWLSRYKSREGKAIARRAWDKCAEEYEAEIKKLKYQVTELMEFQIWLKGFEFSALHPSVWERRADLLQRLSENP